MICIKDARRSTRRLLAHNRRARRRSRAAEIEIFTLRLARLTFCSVIESFGSTVITVFEPTWAAAGDAVSQWRIDQLSEKGLDDVEPEARFALLCWDVLRAAEFRFNEAKLLGHAVGMDVAALEQAGLIAVKQDKVRLLSARERRRDKPLSQEEAAQTLFGWLPGEKKKHVKKKDAVKVHPRDPQFRTKIDLIHGLALEYLDAGGGRAGIGAAKGLALRHGVKAGDAASRADASPGKRGTRSSSARKGCQVGRCSVPRISRLACAAAARCLVLSRRIGARRNQT
jgi:hypothetical protein